MNYDTYKLATDRDNCTDMVTSCCGVDERVKENLADDSKIYYCSECGETDDFYSMIEDYEYEENQKDFYRNL